MTLRNDIDDHEVPDMSMGEVIRTLRYHDRDLYKGNGKPGITTRLDALETHKDRVEDDLYDKARGVVPQLTEYFAVLKDREQRANARVAILGIAALLAPALWDGLKHALGWKLQ